MEGQFSYQDFDLLIEPGPAGSYRARALRSPAGESAPVQFTLPFSGLELENFVLKVSRGRRTRGPGRPESAPLKDFGGKLYSAVFQDELRDVLQRSLSLTRAQQAGMRLRLRLADTPELAELPWEFLYDPRHNRFLAQSRRTPLVRYLDLPDPPQPLSVEGPLRLLVMISSPSDYPVLDTEQEWSLLTGALARQEAEGRVVIERLAASMSVLRQRLRRDEFHVFHFIGHGRYRPDWGSGVLVMEDRAGRAQEVTGEELGGLLTEYDQTRLAVLNACEGARSEVSDPFAGVAQSLIQQGLPAVVAMQFEITDDAAIIFAREFYGAIADGYPLEAALAEARGAIRDEGNPTEWGTPVLYSRAPDGHLFDMTRPLWDEADRQAREEADRQQDQAFGAYVQEAAGSGNTSDQLTKLADLCDRGVITPAEFEREKAKVLAEPEAREKADRQAREQVGRPTELDPAAADPDGLAAQARQRLDHGAAPATPAGSTQVTSPAAETGRGKHHQLSTDIATTQPAAARGVPRLACTLTGHKGWRNKSVNDVTFSPDGRLLASCSDDLTVRLWDPATGEPLRTLTGHTDFVNGVAFSPAGGLLASCADDDTVRLWDPATGELLRTLTGHTNSVKGVAFSPDGRLLASCSDDKAVRLWDPATGEPLRTLAGRTDRIKGVAFSPDGRLLASCGAYDRVRQVRLWDPATGEPLHTLAGRIDRAEGEALSPEAQRLADLIDWATGVAFSPDGRLLAAGGYVGKVWLWDPATGEPLHTLAGDSYRVNGVAFSPDGRLLASGGIGGVRLWDPATGEPLHTLTDHTGQVMAVAFSPDGRLLASSEDKTVRLWAFIPALS